MFGDFSNILHNPLMSFFRRAMVRLYAGVFFPFGQEGDMPSEQGIENGLSNTFTSEPLSQELAIPGFPKCR